MHNISQSADVIRSDNQRFQVRGVNWREHSEPNGIKIGKRRECEGSLHLKGNVTKLHHGSVNI